MTYIQYIDYYLPSKCLTNEEISEEHPEWSIDKISSKTGIYKRYISGEGETAGDMALAAAEKLFANNPIDKAGIDFVLLCTQSPDYFLPTTACIIQHKLGLSNKCGALDYNLGCSGFIYGLGLAKGLLDTNQAHNVLLITSETYTKLLHRKDKSCKTIFGDGAAAIFLSTSRAEGKAINAEVKNFSYGTRGEGFNNLIVKNGGSRNPIKGFAKDKLLDNGSFYKNDDYLFMDGKAIFDFTAFNVPSLINENLLINNLSKTDIDLFIFHQANQFMLNFLRKRMLIPINKFYVNIADGGNTVSSTIPIALERAFIGGIVHDGMHIQLCGFGVGLSMGAVILRL